MLSLYSSRFVALVGAVVTVSIMSRSTVPPDVQPNANVPRAGVLHDSVLNVAIQAREMAHQRRAASAHDHRSVLRAGHRAQLTVGAADVLRSSLDPRRTRSAYAMDSLVVAPGAEGEITTRATVAAITCTVARLPVA